MKEEGNFMNRFARFKIKMFFFFIKLYNCTFYCIKLFLHLTVYWACTKKERKVSYYSSTSLSESFAVHASHHIMAEKSI